MTAVIPELASKYKLMKYNGIQIQKIFRGTAIVIGPISGLLYYKLLSIGNLLYLSILAQIYIICSKNNFIYKKYNDNYIEVLLWLWSVSLLIFNLFSFAFSSTIIASYAAIITPYLLIFLIKILLVVSTVTQDLLCSKIAYGIQACYIQYQLYL